MRSVDGTTDDLLKDKKGEEWHRKVMRRKRKGTSGDLESGYSSMLESGYSSNRDSASPIPTLGSTDHEDGVEDERERVWLMCQGGTLPARVIENQVDGPEDTEYVKIQLEGDSQDIIIVERRFTEKVST